MIPLPPDAALSPLNLAMAADLFRAVNANRAHLGVFLPWVPRTRRVVDTQAFILTEDAKRAQGRSFPFAVYHHGQLRGLAHLFSVKGDPSAGELGYWLTREAQGHGLITRACVALTALGLGSLGYTSIQIRCDVGNRASQRVPERLGWPRVERQVEDWGEGGIRDLWVYRPEAP